MKLRIASPVICDSIVDGPGLRMVYGHKVVNITVKDVTIHKLIV